MARMPANRRRLLEMVDSIPEERWFWARLVFATASKRSLKRQNPRVEVWLNLMLLRASTAEEAIRKAEELGRREAGDDGGSMKVDGEPAEQVFLGIQNIGLIHDPLEDGAEILWDRRITPLGKAKSFVARKSTLRRFLHKDGVL